MGSWIEGPLLGFDTETTGVDPATDRIVSAALVTRGRGRTVERVWLIDPGVEIPASAVALHGITTARVRTVGRSAVEALEEVATLLAAAMAGGVPVVAFNAPYDLSILEAELLRHGLPTLGDRLGGQPAPVVDPLVLDRAVDGARGGQRRLGDLVAEYAVGKRASMHTAEVDVLATLDVLAALVARHPEVGAMEMDRLQEWQRLHHRSRAAELNARRAARGAGGPDVDPGWPLPAVAVRSPWCSSAPPPSSSRRADAIP